MNDKTETQGQGKTVSLPDGTRRIDFIRDNYYTDGVHTDDTDMSRAEIKNAINKQLEDAGLTDQQIPYQIVFAATKTDEDPRIAAAARAEERAKVKAEKDAAKAEEKAAAKAAKEEAAAEKAAAAAEKAAKKASEKK